MSETRSIAWWDRRFDLLLLVAAAVLLGSVVWATAAAAHWPLVGDEALMHYVVLLLGRGSAPYREIIDFNLPGSYLLDALTMRWFGAGAGGLRVYDGLLCLLICACCTMLGHRGWRGRTLGMMAGLLFVLIHLRDGLHDAGQRELAMSALMLLGYVLLLRAPVRRQTSALLGFELLVGLTLIIKPTLVLLALVPLVAMRWRATLTRSWRTVGALGLLVAPWVTTAVWLWTRRSLESFWHVLETLGSVHQQLERHGVGRLLSHALDPMAWLFGGVALIAFVGRHAGSRGESRRNGRDRSNGEDAALLMGAGVALVSLLLQGKGFPYQRYPLLVLVLILSFRALDMAWTYGGQLRVAVLIILLTSAGAGGLYGMEIATYDRYPQEVGSLTNELKRLGARDGEVQCMDTTGGCINALYNDGLRQATGYLYDCYAYTGSAARQAAYRQAFLRATAGADPKYMVFSSQFCLEAKGSFDRLTGWPEMSEWVRLRYQLAYAWDSKTKQRWWSHPDLPFAYRIYERR